MGEMMKCPLCGGLHPEGTTFCNAMWAEIPREPAEELRESEDGEYLRAEDSEGENRGRCPACGAPGIPGDECWQCGSTIESLGLDAQSCRVLLRVADGVGVPIEPGKTMVIGREGDMREVSDLLVPFDVVSRRHCTVRLNQDATMVTITDCGSTNGTFVGPSAERLGRDAACTMKLPAQLRLGSCVNITLELEA